MDYAFSTLTLLAGRAILGGYFIHSGLQHFKHRHAMSGYATSKKVPMPMAAVLVTGVMMIFGGIAILLEKFQTIGIWMLVAFLVPTTFIMHRFWKIEDPMARMNERIQFSKNLAITGALLIIFGTMCF